ncbi:hypothetical protein BH10CHL1_BH10CHL1_37220 [soil metagenome]
MVDEKTARIVWKGTDLDFRATLGRGYAFDMSGSPGPTGGSPMEFLLASAAGCTAIDALMILRKKRLEITNLEVEVSGIQVNEDPHVYATAKILYIVHGKAIKPDAVAKAIELSMTKYCSASIMLKRAGVEMETDFQIVAA